MRIWISLFVVIVGLVLLVAPSGGDTMIGGVLLIAFGIGIQFVRSVPSTGLQASQSYGSQDNISDDSTYDDTSDSITDTVGSFVAAEVVDVVVDDVVDGVVDFFTDD